MSDDDWAPTPIGNFSDVRWLTFFISITTVFVFGAIGNVATVLSIWRNKTLHTPTFMAIACLTFSDLFAVVSRYISLLYSFYLKQPTISWIFSLIYTMSLVLYICSTLHILLLSVMRYVLLVHPIRGLRLVTNRRIRYVSYFIWILSFTSCIPYFITMQSVYRNASADYLMETIVSFILAVIPPVIIISLHCAKLRAIRSPTTAQLHPHQARDMSYLVAFILGFQVIATVPSLVHFCFLFVQTSDSSALGTHPRWLPDFKLFVAFSMLVNHAADPIFYFALTPTARRICKKNWTQTKSIYRRCSKAASSFHHGNSATTSTFV
ncbi:hypothetical protein FSP39_021320 [Pinctada imbricata]|uniref:G-protein coupled receptors family 1 profile domain-containing protein n=1 Tax=Pinctada imbricata TaxID=66713 RepID=A0AA88YAB2_PINIB|nr:hypothetical protein FSP39_021320 [Pinctada imbricata]